MTKDSEKIIIILTGGGTGGHIFPLVAVAREIQEKLRDEAEFLFIGPAGKLEKEAMEKEGIASKIILCGKMRRYFSLKNIPDAFRTPIGIIQSLWLMLKFMPDAVFAKGGYASFPVVIAAWLYRIPVLIHESDAIPGSSNRVMASFANRIAYSYPTAEEYFPKMKLFLTGNPIRQEILGGSMEIARNKFNLAESMPTILVIGGSQGCQAINEAIIRVLPQLLHRAQVIHQTGDENFDSVVRGAATVGVKAGHGGYQVFPFLSAEDLGSALAASDLVITRAGANAISEIAAYGKPLIIIPLTNSANNHQQMNAYAIAKIGGAIVLEESNLGEHILLEKIDILLHDKGLARDMGEKARVFYHPDAAERIAEGVINLIEN